MAHLTRALAEVEARAAEAATEPALESSQRAVIRDLAARVPALTRQAAQLRAERDVAQVRQDMQHCSPDACSVHRGESLLGHLGC